MAEQTAQEFFASLAGRVDPARAAEINHTYAFDIGGAGQWTVDVGEDGVMVSEGLKDADATITASEEVFMKIVDGSQNATSAYMTGKMKLRGDIGAAMKLQKLF
jgi:putative sterol carrier protein